MSAPIAAWSDDEKAGDGARRRLAVMLVSISLLLVGTVGLGVLEVWLPSDALYRMVTTVATVGYDEIRPLSMAG